MKIFIVLLLLLPVSLAAQSAGQGTLVDWLGFFDVPGNYYIDEEDYLVIEGEGEIIHDLVYLITSLEQIEDVFDIDLEIAGLTMRYGKRVIEIHEEELFELIDLGPRERSQVIREEF